MDKPVVVLIPGLGDDTRIYQTFANQFRRFGYGVHVISFGWADTHASLTSKLPRFLARIDELGKAPLLLVGISAGGTAAILCMAQRQNVRKVIAVCSPFDTLPSLHNPLLAESIERVRQELPGMDQQRKQRILSVFGLYDQVVATRLSRIDGVATKRILGLVHAPIIFIALMLYTRSLVHSLRTP